MKSCQKQVFFGEFVALKRAGFVNFSVKRNLFIASLLGEEDGLDVGENTTLGDGDAAEEFVQLFVVSDGELEMSRDDSGFLVVSGSVSGQFEDFSAEVFEDGGEVDWGTGSDSFGVVALSEHSVDSTDGELETSSDGSGLCLRLGFSSFAFSGHVSKNDFFFF